MQKGTDDQSKVQLGCKTSLSLLLLARGDLLGATCEPPNCARVSVAAATRKSFCKQRMASNPRLQR